MEGVTSGGVKTSGSQPRNSERNEELDQKSKSPKVTKENENGNTSLQTDQAETTDEQKVNNNDEESTILDRSMRYEYYIHYEGLDRRLDRFVTEHFIRVDDQDEIQRLSKECQEKED